MSSRPWTVMLVSPDRALLRCLSKFLTVAGYETQSLADVHQAADGCASTRVDFAIVDADAGLGDVLDAARRFATEDETGHRTYTFLLTGRSSSDGVEQALAAGVDDILAKPIVFGELLTRFRAGARVVEFERRCRERGGVDPLTRLPNRTAFEARLQRELSAAAHGPGLACVLLDVDQLQRSSDTHAAAVNADVLREVAARLRELPDAGGMLAYLGGERFGWLAAAASEDEAAAWAEQARACLADTAMPQGTAARPLTCSAGVAATAGEAATVGDVLQRAGEALDAAKAAGRNCVVRFSGLAEDAKLWADFAAPDKLFDRTTARDIMTPCPCVLRASDTVDHAQEVLRRTRLEAVAVVDAGGKVIGLAADEQLHTAAAGRNGAARKVSDVMLTDVPVYAEDTPLATLHEFFERDARSLVVIARELRPLGTLSVDNFAALAGRITTGTFLPAASFSPAADYLVVPDVCPPAELPG